MKLIEAQRELDRLYDRSDRLEIAGQDTSGVDERIGEIEQLIARIEAREEKERPVQTVLPFAEAVCQP